MIKLNRYVFLTYSKVQFIKSFRNISITSTKLDEKKKRVWQERLFPKPWMLEDDTKESILVPFKLSSSKKISSDVLEAIPKNKDSYKLRKQKLKLLTQMGKQRYDEARVQRLGFDLGAAEFVIGLEGLVKCKGHSKWFSQENIEELPSIFSPSYFIDRIDLSYSNIMYDGLQNFVNLHYLEFVDFSHCEKFDNWCMDRTAGQFMNNVEDLDVSYCPLITLNGLECVTRMKKLKKLRIHGYDHIPNLHTFCTILEECMPGLVIYGRPHPGQSRLEGETKKHINEDKDWDEDIKEINEKETQKP